MFLTDSDVYIVQIMQTFKFQLVVPTILFSSILLV